MDVNNLFFSFLFSIIGMCFFSYGRKNDLYFLLSGIALMVYPYFVSQTTSLIITGAILVIAPFLLGRFFPL